MNDPSGAIAVISAADRPAVRASKLCVAAPLSVTVPVNSWVTGFGVGTVTSGPLSQADPTRARASNAARDGNNTLDRRIFSPKTRARTYLPIVSGTAAIPRPHGPF